MTHSAELQPEPSWRVRTNVSLVSRGTGRQMRDLGLPEHLGVFPRGGELRTRSAFLGGLNSSLDQVKVRKGEVSQDKCFPRLAATGGTGIAPDSP